MLWSWWKVLERGNRRESLEDYAPHTSVRRFSDDDKITHSNNFTGEGPLPPQIAMLLLRVTFTTGLTATVQSRVH